MKGHTQKSGSPWRIRSKYCSLEIVLLRRQHLQSDYHVKPVPGLLWPRGCRNSAFSTQHSAYSEFLAVIL